jgi:AraC-like DNA-binding protein
MRSMLSLRHYRDELIAHSHEHAQLVFGLSGLLQIEVNGHASQVVRHSLVVVPGATAHASDSRSGSQCLVLDVPSSAWLEQHLGPHAEHSQRLMEQSATLALSPRQHQLVDWLASSPINDPVIAQQGAALLLASLASETPAPDAPLGLPLTALTAYIDQHLAHPLQVADLARLSGLSCARLHVRFLTETGQTPMEFVRNRRLQLAQQLLRSTRLAVGEIASRVGYNSQSAFTAALARHSGNTPSKLRRELHDKAR